MALSMLADLAGMTSGFWYQVGAYLTPQSHFLEFLKGRVDAYDAIYFVTVTAFFLFLAVRSLESRKWR